MKTLMITESNFPIDIRVKREAYKLVENGHKVSVIALKYHDQAYCETLEGVNVYRVPKIELFKSGKQIKSKNAPLYTRLLILSKGIIGYGIEYLYFTLASILLSVVIMFKDKFDVIHTHNPPDTLFVIPLFYKIFGIKFIYDHHDLSPDLFIEKYGSRGSLIYRLLLLLEKLSCRTADLIIATNESYKKIEIERCGVKAENIFIVRNGPDLKEMRITEPIHAIRSKAKTVLCYLGEINIQDGVDYILVTFAKMLHDYKVKDARLLIIGDGDYLPNIKRLAGELLISKYIDFTGFIYDRDLLNRYLSTADIFVDAAPYSFLNDNSTFIKHMEYMVFKKPIVSFMLKESAYSLKDAGIFVPPNDTDKMAKAIIKLINDEPQKKQLGKNAEKRVKELSWDKVSRPLIQAYERLKK